VTTHSNEDLKIALHSSTHKWNPGPSSLEEAALSFVFLELKTKGIMFLQLIPKSSVSLPLNPMGNVLQALHMVCMKWQWENSKILY
jgi:hypothetical protein